MGYRVFISYSTNDFPIVEHVRRLLANSAVEVFIAEYSVAPGAKLADNIINAIKNCDLFVLLWSRNSEASEWVPQEIGIARGDKKTILPIVLEDRLQLPGFIKELKYLPAYRNPSESLIWLQKHIIANAEKQQQTNALVLMGLSAVLVWLFTQKRASCKSPILPFDKLRVNGIFVEIINLFPFVVSLSNHKKDFCKRLKS